MAETEIKQVELPEAITVADFAVKIGATPAQVITKLMQNGVMATLNEAIDRDTAEIIGAEFSVVVVAEKSQKEKRAVRSDVDGASSRPPIVAVMGHVDHGKTSLLDAIRKTDTTASEAGGITQHISAYQISYKKRKITFLDTPGHEAFAALRQHGAQLTDVAIIVVAADDGIKPQTKEAIKFAKRAGVKIIVALNKIDTPGADPNRVKQELSDNELMPEEWGGDTVIVEVSAKEGTNIDALLDLLVLVSDIEELKADMDGAAEGIVIESNKVPGKGSVATVLVEHGKLQVGDLIVAGTAIAKVRSLENDKGEVIEFATASTPAIVVGFKELPRFGDVFTTVPTEKEARKLAAKYRVKTNVANAKSAKPNADSFMELLTKKELKELPVIVRGDVQGSVESVVQSLADVGNDEVSVNVIDSGVGEVTETDISRANSANALVLGFNVSVGVQVKKLAITQGVRMQFYTVIYELLDDVKALLTQMLPPEVVVEEIGTLLVKGVFRTTKNEVICGGEVTKGKIRPNAFAEVFRNKVSVGEAKLVKVQRDQSVVKEVVEGQLCGLSLDTKSKILVEEGDRIVITTREERARTL